MVPAVHRQVTWKGELESEALAEASGLAASQSRKATFYSINDSGNEPRLFVIGERGEDRGSFPIDYEDNHDFEDLSSFQFEGDDYLLLADTGDNFNWRPYLTVLVLREPDIDSLAQDTVLQPVWRFNYTYPNGYRDCEAVAVDESNNRILLISKRRVPAEVFSLPLRPESENVVARLEARLEKLPQPSQRDLREDSWYGRSRSMPTALDIHKRKAIVITYRDAWLYRRDRRSRWAEAFTGEPERIALPDIYGLESGTMTREGRSLVLVGESEEGVGRMGIYEVEL